MTQPAPPPAANAKYRVLVIEDDPQVARLIRMNLMRVGLECRYAADGPAGLAAFTEMKPQLVLLDLVLPGMRGSEVCAKIRESSTVPIIIMTAADTEEAQLQCFKYGADDYVSKPFDPRLMAARVIAHLRRVYRYDADTKNRALAAAREPLPEGWLRCGNCRHQAVSTEFEDLNSQGVLDMICPRCGERVKALRP